MISSVCGNKYKFKIMYQKCLEVFMQKLAVVVTFGKFSKSSFYFSPYIHPHYFKFFISRTCITCLSLKCFLQKPREMSSSLPQKTKMLPSFTTTVSII